MTNSPRKIILGVTGGIAAYKAADLCSKLVQLGADVRVAFSSKAEQFIAPLTFEALSGHPVYRNVFDDATAFEMEHISWARWADVFVIAPATADTIARLAGGHGDDAITTLYLAFRGQTYLAPSMNTAMLEHGATQHNLATLRERGVKVITPGEGALACGEVGSGRMAEPADIIAALGFSGNFEMTGAGPGQAVMSSGRPADDSLRGSTVLITSGPTREFLDPVRFLSSPSSGRMGLALANEALRRGARVHFITGPVDASLMPVHSGDDRLTVHKVTSAMDMLQAAREVRAECNLMLFAAAVGDFRPSSQITQKIKRTGNSISLPLVENPDIAMDMGFAKTPDQVLIGFAAESDDHRSNANNKIAAKRLDAVVLNDITNPDIAFASPDNEVVIITASGREVNVPRKPKAEIAYEILEVALDLINEKIASD